MIKKLHLALLLVSAGTAALAQEAVPPNRWTGTFDPTDQVADHAAPEASAKSDAQASLPTTPDAFRDGTTRGSRHFSMTLPLTRAVVRADLAFYRESGLAALEAGDSPDWDGPAHRAAAARYAALRQSPRYAELVRQFGGSPEAKTLAQYGAP